MTVSLGAFDVTWLGYACARVSGSDDTVVYVDPGRYGTLDDTWNERYGPDDHPDGRDYRRKDADVVLVTHDHHYDDDGVRRVSNEDTTVVVYESVDAERVSEGGRDVVSPEELPYEVRRVATGETLTVAGVDVDVVPAYNDPEGPRASADGSVPHPEGFGCGFRFVVDGRACFWPGDSDFVPEHETVDTSVLLPSIAQSYTMTRHGAAELAETLRPELVVPIHYNTFPELRADADAFAVDVANRGIPVALDERGPDGT